MTNDKERQLFQIAVSVWYFAAGADRSSVIPTVNEYLMSLGADQDYIGYVISLFAVGSIISAPLMGRLADKLGTSRPLVLFGICCHLCGAVVYFTAPKLPGTKPELWIVLGRFLAGVGYGLDGAIIGTMSKIATADRRSAVISRTILLRQVGVVLGPLSILGLRMVNFTLPGGTVVDQYNSLGFALMFLWLIVFFPVFFLYHDSELIIRSNRETPEKELTNKEEQQPIDESKFKFVEVSPIDSIFREQIIVCLIGSFCGMFLQASLETMFTPMSKRLLGFTSMENAVTYVAIGVIAVAGYFSIKYANKYFKDRTLLYFGLVAEFLNTIILFAIIPSAQFRVWYLYVFLGICIFFQVFCMAYLVVASATLLSKFSPKDKQATIQGFRIAVETVSTILAPIWIATTLNYGFVINFSAPFALVFLALILLTLSFKVMEPSHIKTYYQASHLNIVKTQRNDTIVKDSNNNFITETTST